MIGWLCLAECAEKKLTINHLKKFLFAGKCNYFFSFVSLPVFHSDVHSIWI